MGECEDSDHVIIDPPNDLKLIPKSSKESLEREHMRISHETMVAYDDVTGSKYDLIEVCAPWDSNLGKEIEKQGGKVFRMGPHNGFDLTTKAGLIKATKVFRETRPRHVHLSPACFPWSQFQNLNMKTEEQRERLFEKRQLGRRLLKNLVTLGEIQVQELDGGLSGEQPWTASSWSEPTWSKLARMAGGRFRVDGCRFGMKSPENGLLFQKAWGFFCTNPRIRIAIQRTCNHPPQAHTPIQGKMTALTAEYPVQLCKHFVTALMDRRAEYALLCHSTCRVHEHVVEHSPENCAGIHVSDIVEHGDDNDIHEPESHDLGPGPDEQEDQAVVQPIDEEVGVYDLNREELNRLRTVHRNLGHPHSSVLVRMLKQSGAAENFIKAADKLECDVCKQNAPKKPALPASPNVSRIKWDTVTVDTFWWKHPRKTDKGADIVGVSFMDEATDLHVACVVREGEKMLPSVSADEFRKAFSEQWLQHFPKPKNLRFDVEGCFRGNSVMQWLEENMIQSIPIAGEAPWQLGKHSRHLDTLKQQMTKLAIELDDHVKLPEILALCVSAKNEMHAIKGYSPNQWAFGQNSERVWSFLNCYEHLPSMSSENPTFHENIKKMAMAREIFIKHDSMRRLQRIGTLKSRKQQVFHTGDLVYYYRKGRSYGAKVKGTWRGPARVLFVEKTSEGERGNVGSIVWVSHGTVLLRCAPEQLQHVTRDLRDIDELVNGPFSPDEFLKGKHVHVDLMSEQRDVIEDAIDQDDTVWRRDANNLEIDANDDGQQSEPPRVRYRIKTNTDKVAIKPLVDDHVGSRPASQGCHREGHPSDQRGLPEDERPGTGTDDSGTRTAQREELRLGVEEPDLLRDLVRFPPQGDSRLDGLPDVHSEKDRRVGEEEREAIFPDIPEEGPGDVEGREGGHGYRPVRRERHVVGNRRRWLEGSREGISELDSEPRSRDSAVGSSRDRAHADDGADEPSSAGIGEPDRSEMSESNRSRKFDNQTAELGNQTPNKRLKTVFQKKKQAVEIILHVGPRDVHFEKRNKQTGIWVVNAKAKRSAEVNVRDLTDKEHEEFKEAKGKEINSYMEHMAVDICEKHGIDPERVLGMRWILTWKPVTDDVGCVVGRKPKARLIIKGFQDPDLLKIPRDSPTLSTLGRNMLFSVTAQRRWRLAIGDIKTAFLNGDDTEVGREIYGEPPDDVKDYLGMTKDQFFRVRKAIYGLLNAPRKWMEKLFGELRKDGWIQSTMEPCFWRLYEHGSLVGVLGVHVDDVVSSGDGDFYRERVRRLRSVFPFGSWKHAVDESVTFCGCEVTQNLNGSLDVKQERFALGLNEVNMSRERKQQEESVATDEEKKQMKGLLGGLAWRANQTAPWLSATTSILQGHTQAARVKDVLLANKLCRLQRAQASVGLHFSNEIQEPVIITFSDASHANRADGSSQGGNLTVLTDRKILNGEQAPFSVLTWHSKKLKRIARSSTCAEVQACSNAYDDLEYIKQMYCEIQNEKGINTKTADALIAEMDSAVIVDAKNLYDAVTRVTSAGLQLEEKRLCLEVLHMKERAKNINAPMKWVDSDQQFANDLTKLFCVDQLLDLMKLGKMSIVFDPTFTSAKRKRQRQKEVNFCWFSEMIVKMLEAIKEEDQ